MLNYLLWLLIWPSGVIMKSCHVSVPFLRTFAAAGLVSSSGGSTFFQTPGTIMSVTSEKIIYPVLC